MWLEDGHTGQLRNNRRVVVKSSGKHKSSAHTVYALQLLIVCARLCFTSPPACWSHNFSSQLTRRYLPLGRPAKALSPHYPLSPLPAIVTVEAVNKSFARNAHTLLSASHSLHNHPGRQVLLTRMKDPRLGDGSPRDCLAEKRQSPDSNWLAPQSQSSTYLVNGFH